MKQFKFTEKECETFIPCEYQGISDECFQEVLNQIVVQMYDARDLQRNYKEYIAIAQIEDKNIICPEIILPARLKYKVKDGKEVQIEKFFRIAMIFLWGGHVNSGESYNEAAYRELKEELGISKVKLKEIAYFSPFESKSNTFQKVYFLRYNRDITNYDKSGIVLYVN